MTSRTISQLPPAASPAGDEAIPFARDGENGRITPDQIAARSAQRIQRRPLRIAFAGDSIALIFGQYQTASPFFWSQVRCPRRWDFIGVGNAGGLVAVSGSSSGEIRNSSGSVTHAAVDGGDMNTPLMIARLTAWKPDVLVIEVGTNDGSFAPANDVTFRNVRAVVEAVGARHTILFPVLPRSGHLTPTYVDAYNAYLLEWERTTPGIHVVRLQAYMASNADGVVGGTTGAAGAWTGEGLHPSAVFGRAIEPMLTEIFDAIGAPKIAPRAINAQDVYSAGNPGLNVLTGSMEGTYNGGAYINAPNTGLAAPGWIMSSSGGQTEMWLDCSKSAMVVRGNSVAAQKLVINAAGPLAFDQQCIMRSTPTLPAGTKYSGEGQAVIRLKNLVGIVKVAFSIKGTINGVPTQTVSMGGLFTSQAASVLPTTDETLEYMLPGTLPFDPGTTIDTQIQITGKAGMTPSGEVYVGQVGYHLLTGLPA